MFTITTKGVRQIWIRPIDGFKAVALAGSDLASRPSHHDADEDHEHDDFESFHVAVPALDDPDGVVARVRGMIGQHDVLRLK